MLGRNRYTKEKLQECRELLAEEEHKLENARNIIKKHEEGEQVLHGKSINARKIQHEAIHKTIPELKKRIEKYESFLLKNSKSYRASINKGDQHNG